MINDSFDVLMYQAVCRNVKNLSSQAPETCVNICFKMNLASKVKKI